MEENELIEGLNEDIRKAEESLVISKKAKAMIEKRLKIKEKKD